MKNDPQGKAMKNVREEAHLYRMPTLKRSDFIVFSAGSKKQTYGAIIPNINTW
jgi:hypothetical protein